MSTQDTEKLTSVRCGNKTSTEVRLNANARLKTTRVHVIRSRPKWSTLPLDEERAMKRERKKGVELVGDVDRCVEDDYGRIGYGYG